MRPADRSAQQGPNIYTKQNTEVNRKQMSNVHILSEAHDFI